MRFNYLLMERSFSWGERLRGAEKRKSVSGRRVKKISVSDSTHTDLSRVNILFLHTVEHPADTELVEANAPIAPKHIHGSTHF